PVLVDLDVDGVALVAGVIGPELDRGEAHAVEREQRQTAAVVRELFRVRVAAADALDRAGVAAAVVRRADVAGPRGDANLHAIAGLEARGDRLRYVNRGAHSSSPSCARARRR